MEKIHDIAILEKDIFNIVENADTPIPVHTLVEMFIWQSNENFKTSLHRGFDKTKNLSYIVASGFTGHTKLAAGVGYFSNLVEIPARRLEDDGRYTKIFDIKTQRGIYEVFFLVDYLVDDGVVWRVDQRF